MKNRVTDLNVLKMGIQNEILSFLELNNLNDCDIENVGQPHIEPETTDSIVNVNRGGTVIIVDENQNDWEVELEALDIFDVAAIMDYLESEKNLNKFSTVST